MAQDYGRTVLGKAGERIEVLAGGLRMAQFKPIGITLDWTTVTALGADTTFNNDNLFRAGSRVLRYGQIVTKITASGNYGPFDPAAADGRQNLVRGQAWILNEIFSEFAPFGLTIGQTIHPYGIDAGTVWLERIIQSGTNAHSLAAGPTKAELEATFPMLRYANT